MIVLQRTCCIALLLVFPCLSVGCDDGGAGAQALAKSATRHGGRSGANVQPVANVNDANGNTGMGSLEGVVFKGEEAGWTGKIDNGVYLLHNPREQGGIRYFHTPLRDGEAGKRTVRVDVTAKDTGDGSARAGLLYGFQPNPRCYFMVLASAKGEIEVYRRDDSGVNRTIATTIKPNGASIRLEVVESGRNVKVVADGQTISTFSSRGTGKGAIGIAAMGLGEFGFTNYVETGPNAQAPPPAATNDPNNAAPPATPPPATTARAGQTNDEVLRLKRFDIYDTTGFVRPVLVASFLAPADWKMEGGVNWNPRSPCVWDLVSMRVRVQEPNGRRAFEIFPMYSSQWSPDPQVNRLYNANQPCRNAAPLPSVKFIEQMFIPGFRQGARVLSAKPRPEAAQALHKKVMAIDGAEIQRYQARINIDAAQARIAYDTPAGEVNEWVLATSLVNTQPIAGVAGSDGRQAYTQINFLENVLAFRAPAGELDANERLFATIVSTYRPNPAYEQLIRDVRTNIHNIQIRGAIGRLAGIKKSTAKLFREWNASLDQRAADWKARSAAQDRVNRHLTEAIRGTQSYHDPYNSGTSWELPNDYQHVWKTANDEFIFTNNINYNPNEALNENKWQQMKALR